MCIKKENGKSPIRNQISCSKLQFFGKSVLVFLKYCSLQLFLREKIFKKKKTIIFFYQVQISFLFIFIFIFFVTYSNYAIGLLFVYCFSILVMSLVSNFNTLIFLSLGRLDWKCVVDELGWPAWADHFTKSRVIWAYFL